MAPILKSLIISLLSTTQLPGEPKIVSSSSLNSNKVDNIAGKIDATGSNSLISIR